MVAQPELRLWYFSDTCQLRTLETRLVPMAILAYCEILQDASPQLPSATHYAPSHNHEGAIYFTAG
jgi:hypothetical protein